MANLIGKLFWVLVFLASTFAFVVIFDHGIENFPDNAQREFETLRKLVMQEKPAKKK